MIHPVGRGVAQRGILERCERCAHLRRSIARVKLQRRCRACACDRHLLQRVPPERKRAIDRSFVGARSAVHLLQQRRVEQIDGSERSRRAQHLRCGHARPTLLGDCLRFLGKSKASGDATAQRIRGGGIPAGDQLCPQPVHFNPTGQQRERHGIKLIGPPTRNHARHRHQPIPAESRKMPHGKLQRHSIDGLANIGDIEPRIIEHLRLMRRVERRGHQRVAARIELRARSLELDDCAHPRGLPCVLRQHRHAPKPNFVGGNRDDGVDGAGE